MRRSIFTMVVALFCFTGAARGQFLPSNPTHDRAPDRALPLNRSTNVDHPVGSHFARTPQNSHNWASPFPTNQGTPWMQHPHPTAAAAIPRHRINAGPTLRGEPVWANQFRPYRAVPGPVAFPPLRLPPGSRLSGNQAVANPTQEPIRSVDRGHLLEPAQVLAIVGDQTILAGDLENAVSQLREENADKVTDEQFDEQRPQIIKQLLRQQIDTVLVFNDFLRTMPAERHSEILNNIDDQFDITQMEHTLKKNKVEGVAELEVKLRQTGSSLKKLKRRFAQQVIAQQMIQKNVNRETEVTHEQMLSSYQKNIEDYEFPAKAQWEELTSELKNYRSEATARRELAAMGNEVLRGAPLSAVARRSRQGPQWEMGGLHEWTSQGSLRSSLLDEAIFSLPVGKLSQIISDEDGFHIIRVVERFDAGCVPFTEAQTEIKQKIQKEIAQEQLKDYIAKLREKTPVWTIFDENEDHHSIGSMSTTARSR